MHILYLFCILPPFMDILIGSYLILCDCCSVTLMLCGFGRQNKMTECLNNGSRCYWGSLWARTYYKESEGIYYTWWQSDRSVFHHRYQVYICFPVILSLFLLKLLDLLIKTADELECKLILNGNVQCLSWKKHVVTCEIMCRTIVILMVILFVSVKKYFWVCSGKCANTPRSSFLNSWHVSLENVAMCLMRMEVALLMYKCPFDDNSISLVGLLM